MGRPPQLAVAVAVAVVGVEVEVEVGVCQRFQLTSEP
jgi:hypothetical protein